MQLRTKNTPLTFVQLILLLAAGECRSIAQTAQTELQFFPNQSQFVDRNTGRPLSTPTNRQLTDPASGQSTFSGFNRQLTDPASGRSTFNGYSIKLTDPVTGRPTFKGYGENPLMQNRTSAPDFKWNSNVNADGSSQYIGNNRRLTDVNGRPTFVGNNRQLADPRAKEEFFNQNKPFNGRPTNPAASSNTPLPPGAVPGIVPTSSDKSATTASAAPTYSEATPDSRREKLKPATETPTAESSSGF